MRAGTPARILVDMSDVKFLGTTDDVTTCECCGKPNLKSTVAISVDGGDAMYFGVVCAGRALSRSAKEVRTESRAADRARAEAERKVVEAARRAEDARWQAWLDSQDPEGKGDRFMQIERLGRRYGNRAAVFAAYRAA